jgi:glycosyltransferase involved in cell wall biosynthesis
MNNQLTVVMPTKNEGRSILNVIKLVLSQNYRVQLIIADSSDDGVSRGLLEKYNRFYPYILIDGGLPAIARNLGARLVKTNYILFLDADMYIKDLTLIKYCIKTAIDGDYDLVTCKVRSLDGRYGWVWNLFDFIQKFTAKTKPFAIGGFMLFKTKTFRELNGFCEEDKIAEDYHLSSKIKPEKFKIVDRIVYTPSRRFKNKGIFSL